MNPSLTLASPEPGPADSGGSRPNSVLLVDDDESVRCSLQLGLDRAGAHARVASNGQEALARLAQERFEWMVTDIVMPDMEGLELIQTVRRIYPATRIIAMSGGGRGCGGDYLRVARLFGATQILHKPFPCEELLGLLGKTAKPHPFL